MNGLIGQNIGYSLSKQIYNENLIPYEIYDVDEKNAKDLILSMSDGDFFNITTPYKKLALSLCDSLDNTAKSVDNVNLIIKKDEIIYGMNTDYFGLQEIFSKNQIDIFDKNFAILGDGAVSNTVYQFLKDNKAKNIEIFSRKKGNLQNLKKQTDFYCVINATSISPNIFDKFENLNVAVDLRYSPLNSDFLINAKEKNLKVANGLDMLLSQAKLNVNLALKKNLDLQNTKLKIIRNNFNIVLVGMPGVGKTKIGEILSKKLEMNFIDTDKLIENKMKDQKTYEIIKTYGERVFREIEREQIKNLEFVKGCIISSGGGAVCDEQNRKILRKNAYVFYLHRELEKLETLNRPLSKNLENLFESRKPFYDIVCDEKIFNERIEDTVEKIISLVIK
ncbi:MAG: shikimate kinase [Clostridia bacterium]|nr:shikimate kinase [Clostridia bacterium]